MYPQVVIANQVGNSTPVYFDNMTSPFSVAIGCVVTNEVVYTIQHTFDDLFNVTATQATWFNCDSANLVGASTNQDGNYNAPVRGARVNISSMTTTSMVKVTFVQAGRPGG